MLARKRSGKMHSIESKLLRSTRKQLYRKVMLSRQYSRNRRKRSRSLKTKPRR